MLKPEYCKNIDEIRECIDSIDHQIISLLAQRQDYVNAAAQFKKNSLEVNAPDRVRMMLEMRRLWAIESGLYPDFIEELFKNIVSFFINREMRHFEKKQQINEQVIITRAIPDDAPVILSLQKRAFLQEAERIGNFNIAPIQQNLESMVNDLSTYTVLKAQYGEMIVGSIRAKDVLGACHIGRLFVEPVFQKKGIGTALMSHIEQMYPCNCYELFTAENSQENIRFYSKLGYCIKEKFESEDGVNMVRMGKLI